MNLLSISLQAAAPGQGNPWMTIVMMGLIFVVMYMFMFRPQQKKAREAKKFRENLQKGAKVKTIGGLHGKIVEVSDTSVLIDAGDGVKLRFDKTAIAMDGTMQLTEETAKTS